MTKSFGASLEESRLHPGHYHIEGYCVWKAGRTWTIRLRGCQGQGTEDPNELPHYSSSLSMARDYIRDHL